MSTRYDWTGSQALADPGTTDISFSLPAVTSLDEVSFYATHTYVSDLSVSIVAPSGTTHQIIYRVGGTLDDFGISAADADRTHLRDDAATRICDVSSAVAHSPGTFRPCKFYGGGSEETGVGSGYQDSPLSVFGPQDAGTWKLRFIDYEGGDTGIVYAASLFVTEPAQVSKNIPSELWTWEYQWIPSNDTNGGTWPTFKGATFRGGPVEGDLIVLSFAAYMASGNFSIAVGYDDGSFVDETGTWEVSSMHTDANFRGLTLWKFVTSAMEAQGEVAYQLTGMTNATDDARLYTTAWRGATDFIGPFRSASDGTTHTVSAVAAPDDVTPWTYFTDIFGTTTSSPTGSMFGTFIGSTENNSLGDSTNLDGSTYYTSTWNLTEAAGGATSSSSSFVSDVSIDAFFSSFEVLGTPPPSGGITSTFCETTPLVDDGTLDITFTVPESTGTITDLDIGFYITHTYDADLTIELIHPDGVTTCLLIDSEGSSGDDFGSSASESGYCVIASWWHETFLSDSSPPFVGTFGSANDDLLATFADMDATGDWILRITDTAADDTGSYICGRLNLYGVEGPIEDSITIDIENTHLDTSPPIIPLPASTSDFANWKFVLCNSSDLSSLGELKQARQKQLTIELNRPGSLSFTLPIADRDAYLVDPVRTCVLAYRDNILIWSGPVWIVAEKLIEEQVQVTCLGWSEILFHRLIQPSQAPVTYSSVDAGTIAQNLLAFANAQGQTPALAPSSTFISAGTTTASITRTITYTSLQNIGQAIQQLSDIENGFDFYITPGTRVMDIYYPRLGVDQTGILLGAGDVSIKGLAQVGRNIDASRMANRTWVVGAHETGFAEDTTSQSTYIMLEDTYQLTDVTDSTILAAYANAELAVRYLPLVFVEFDVFPAATFRMFRNFNIGDIIYISARKGRMQFTRQAARVFGATITIDDGGVERVSSIKTRLG